MKLEPIPMPEADATDRLAGFGKVNQGYTEELARAEAERCLQCKNPPCVEGCPVDVDIGNVGLSHVHAIVYPRTGKQRAAIKQLGERNIHLSVEYHFSRNTSSEVSNLVLMRALKGRCIQLSGYVHISGVMYTKMAPKTYT